MSEARKDAAFGRAGGDSGQIPSHLHDSEDQKERLQDELADLLLQTSGEGPDSDQLDALLAALEEIDPMPEDGVPDTEESLTRFHQRYAPLFSPKGDPAAGISESPEKKHSRRLTFKFAAIAAVMILLLGSAAAQAFGLNVFGTIARWSSETFRMRSEDIPYATVRANPLEEGETAYYDTLQDAVDAFGITEPIVPQWVPERFELSEVTATNRKDGIHIYADYACNDEYFQIRYNEKSDFDFRNLEKEIGVELYSYNSVDHYLVSDMERWKVSWQNGELECHMSGNVSGEEIKEIIESIYY